MAKRNFVTYKRGTSITTSTLLIDGIVAEDTQVAAYLAYLKTKVDTIMVYDSMTNLFYTYEHRTDNKLSGPWNMELVAKEKLESKEEKEMKKENDNLAMAMVAIKTYGGYINDHNHDNKITPIERVLGVCELANGDIGLLLSVDCYYSINEVYVDDMGYAHVGTSSVSGTVHCNEMANEEDIVRFNESILATSLRIIRVLYVNGSLIDLTVKPEKKEDRTMPIDETLTIKERVKIAFKNTLNWVTEKFDDDTNSKMYYISLVVLFIGALLDIKRCGYKEHVKKCFIFSVVTILIGAVNVAIERSIKKTTDDVIFDTALKNAIKNAPTMDLDDLA